MPPKKGSTEGIKDLRDLLGIPKKRPPVRERFEPPSGLDCVYTKWTLQRYSEVDDTARSLHEFLVRQGAVRGFRNHQGAKNAELICWMKSFDSLIEKDDQKDPSERKTLEAIILEAKESKELEQSGLGGGRAGSYRASVDGSPATGKKNWTCLGRCSSTISHWGWEWAGPPQIGWWERWFRRRRRSTVTFLFLLWSQVLCWATLLSCLWGKKTLNLGEKDSSPVLLSPVLYPRFPSVFVPSSSLHNFWLDDGSLSLRVWAGHYFTFQTSSSSFFSSILLLDFLKRQTEWTVLQCDVCSNDDGGK